MKISLIFYRSKPILDDSLKSTKKIQFESFWLRISFILADKLEEVFEIRSSPGLGRAHWAKVHFASEGLSIPVLGRNEIWKEFFSHFSFTIAWLPTFSPKSFFKKKNPAFTSKNLIELILWGKLIKSQNLFVLIQELWKIEFDPNREIVL